jgi:hypothetical protein
MIPHIYLPPNGPELFNHTKYINTFSHEQEDAASPLSKMISWVDAPPLRNEPIARARFTKRASEAMLSSGP